MLSRFRQHADGDKNFLLSFLSCHLHHSHQPLLAAPHVLPCTQNYTVIVSCFSFVRKNVSCTSTYTFIHAYRSGAKYWNKDFWGALCNVFLGSISYSPKKIWSILSPFLSQKMVSLSPSLSSASQHLSHHLSIFIPKQIWSILSPCFLRAYPGLESHKLRDWKSVCCDANIIEHKGGCILAGASDAWM